MSRDDNTLPRILARSRTRAVFGAGVLAELGKISAAEGATHVFLVTDPGIVAAGHVDRAVTSLREAGLMVTLFDRAAENPTTEHVSDGVDMVRKTNARGRPIDLLVGLGGGSSMDCAKGINFIHTNGGEMKDYWGMGKATKAMLPMIAVPTTAGTGSEAQSFALISDPATRTKMACGDKKAACRVALLDPELTLTQPKAVAAATGIDAISHAVETAVTTRRNEVSLEFTREAWSRLSRSYETVMRDSTDAAARADMLLGAHLAGAAIEHSMLGAAHACASPLTARCGITHGVAVGIMLPHVVRFNGRNGSNLYAALAEDANRLASRIGEFVDAAGLPRSLSQCGVSEGILASLAEEAAQQWTARFNPVQVGEAELLELYRAALA